MTREMSKNYGRYEFAGDVLMDTPLDQLAEQFRRLPGIGIKTARRLAYFMVQQPEEKTTAFIEAIRQAKTQMRFLFRLFQSFFFRSVFHLY